MGNLWSYPAGMIVNNVLLTERTVLGASSFCVGDVGYGPEFLTHFTADQLAAFEIKSFGQDTLLENYLPGIPVKVETATHIQITYPNAVLDEDAQIETALDAITAKYAAKRTALQSDILRCLTMDGPNMESNLATLRAKWPTLALDESDEIDALFT